MGKPDVDLIEGLSPAISIEQKTTSRNPRSTVGTVTEIHDYMRLLWARVGVPYSPATGLPIESQTVSQMVDKIMALPEGTRLLLLAPVVRDRKGEYRKEIADCSAAAYQRLKVDGKLYRSRTPGAEPKTSSTTSTWWWTASWCAGHRAAPGRQFRNRAAPGRRHRRGRSRRGRRAARCFLEKFACPVSGFTIEEIEPRLFSFNKPARRLPGLRRPGHEAFFDADLVVPDEGQEPAQGRVAPWAGAPRRSTPRPCRPGAPLRLLDGRPGGSCRRGAHAGGAERLRRTRSNFVYKDDNARKYEVNKTFEGVLPNLERRWRETDSAWVREEAGPLPAETPCERLPRRAAEARGAGGEDRRQEHRRGLHPVDPPGALDWFASLEPAHAASRWRSPGGS
jgi:excinuclease ABC subunit A